MAALIAGTGRGTELGPRKKLLASVAALVLTGGFTVWHLSNWPVRLRYPGEWCGIEGMRLVEMVHFRQGIPIYGRPSVERFDATIYGPLYYLLGSRLVDPSAPGYLPLRLLAAVGTLGCSTAAAWLAFRLSGSRLSGALAPLIFLSYGIVSFYGTSARADSWALLLTYCGVLVAHYFRGNSGILLAAPLFLISFFYKQQFVAAPLAVLLFLALERRYRLAAAFAAIMAAAGLGLLALFQFIVFRGQDFFLHFFSYNLLPFSWVQFKGAAIIFAIAFVVPSLVGVESLRVQREKFLACYLACAVFSALLGAGKEGSDTNYFLECIFLLGVLFAALLARRIAEPARAMELLVLLVVAILVGQFFTPSPPSPQDFERDRAVQAYLRTHYPPGTRALSYYAGDMIRAGLELPISDVFQYTRLARAGALDDKGLVTQLEEQEYGVVVLDVDLGTETQEYWLEYSLTEPVRRAVQAHYRMAATLEMPDVERLRSEARLYIWTPRVGPPSNASPKPPKTGS